MTLKGPRNGLLGGPKNFATEKKKRKCIFNFSIYCSPSRFKDHVRFDFSLEDFIKKNKANLVTLSIKKGGD